MESVEVIANHMDRLLSTSLALPCEIAHYILVISAIKQTWESSHTRSQPLTTYATSIFSCFGGSTIVNLVCGNPMLTPFTNTKSLLLASLIWWLIFYSPMDIFSTTTKILPLNIVLLVLKEIVRTRKVLKGIAISRPVYPSSLFLCSVLGMVGACGGGFVKTGITSLTKPWNSNSIKTFTFSTVTKTCLLFSVLYNLEMNGYIHFSIKVLALIQASFLSTIMVSNKLGIPFNPYSLFETITCSVFIDYTAFSSSANAQQNGEAKKSKSEQKSSKDKKKD